MNILEIQNLSKQYRLGNTGTNSLGHDINRWWYTVRGKEDPYLKIGETNDRALSGNSEYVWALQNINFTVEKGEILGIIGANGAGKSTLLKILSRVTGPTTGKIIARGRIASLLEVGTGFHGDLTGRENIYLNGAILGMTKREISSKIDEIIDFSGCERYIDTPVKRYSSGMYVRLAFAVAAHLEPEILIIDEVLAVGDAEFQKKAIGKMQDVSKGEGRTVLFVSHNMTAVKSICNRGLVLKNGLISFEGDIDNAIHNYLDDVFTSSSVEINEENEFVKIDYIKIKDNKTGHFDISESFIIEIGVQNKIEKNINVNLFFKNSEKTLIFATCSDIQFNTVDKFIYECTIPSDFLNDNNYYIDVMVVENGEKVLFEVKDVLKIKGIEPKRAVFWLDKFPGQIKPKLHWLKKNIE